MLRSFTRSGSSSSSVVGGSFQTLRHTLLPCSATHHCIIRSHNSSNENNPPPTSSALSSSGFLSSLLKNSSSSSSASTDNNSSRSSSSVSRVPLLFDPASLKLDVAPKGLSEKMRKQQKARSGDPAEHQQDEEARQPFLLANVFERVRREEQKREHDHYYSSRGETTGHTTRRRGGVATAAAIPTTSNPHSNEASLALLSISSRMGDWEEAMRVASRHWSAASQNQQQDSVVSNDGSRSSVAQEASSSKQQIKMAAQATWACSQAIEHAALSSSSSSSSSADVAVEEAEAAEEEADIALGPVEALNAITDAVISRVEQRERRQDDESSSSAVAVAAFLRETTGGFLAMCEALRACGGIDLILKLDQGVGDRLRRDWQSRGLLIETQRWNHEMIKTFDLCNDWCGALGFFLLHSSSAQQPAGTATAVAMEMSQNHEKKEEAASSSVEKDPVDVQDCVVGVAKPFLFSGKNAKKTSGDETTTSSSSSSSSDNNDNTATTTTTTVSIFGASTIAMLIELLGRSQKQRIVMDLLRSKDCIRPAEAAAIGRAYAMLINSWSRSAASRRRTSDQSPPEHDDNGTKIVMPKFVSENYNRRF